MHYRYELGFVKSDFLFSSREYIFGTLIQSVTKVLPEKLYSWSKIVDLERSVISQNFYY